VKQRIIINFFITKYIYSKAVDLFLITQRFADKYLLIFYAYVNLNARLFLDTETSISLSNCRIVQLSN